jgi:hypothetical protein
MFDQILNLVKEHLQSDPQVAAIRMTKRRPFMRKSQITLPKNWRQKHHNKAVLVDYYQNFKMVSLQEVRLPALLKVDWQENWRASLVYLLL